MVISAYESEEDRGNKREMNYALRYFELLYIKMWGSAIASFIPGPTFLKISRKLEIVLLFCLVSIARKEIRSSLS